MIGFLSENHHNHPRQYPNRRHPHHQRRSRRNFDFQFKQVKLLGWLTSVVILLLGTRTTFTSSLPTPSSVHLTNNRQQSSERHTGHYFDNDQLLADLWTKLCGWTNRSGSCISQATLPVGVADAGTGSDDTVNNGNVIDRSSSSTDERQLLVEALQRFLRDAIVADNGGNDGRANLASVTYEEEPEPTQLQLPPSPPPPKEKLAPAPSPSKLNQIFLTDDGATPNYEILANDKSSSSSSLPFSDDNIQRQVIFIQIPETMVNLHVHKPPPQTIVYVLPSKEESHQVNILDMRESKDPVDGVKQATPAVHFLTNFGNNKIDTDQSVTTRQPNNQRHHHPPPNQRNLYEQSQSKSNSRGYQQEQQHQNRNKQDQRFVLPVKGILMPPPPPLPPAVPSFNNPNRFNQHSHFFGQINNANLNSKGANKDFEIEPAVNGYFYI